jgi:hypothetical protein
MTQPELEKKLLGLEKQLKALSAESVRTNPNVHPETVKNLGTVYSVPYTSGTPTLLATTNGTPRYYFDGTNYWLYIYANGAWKKTQLT